TSYPDLESRRKPPDHRTAAIKEPDHTEAARLPAASQFCRISALLWMCLYARLSSLTSAPLRRGLLLRRSIERAEGTLVPGGAHIAPRVPWRTGRNRPLAESVRMKIRPPAPTRRAPRRIAKRRSIRPPAETRAAFPC